MAKQSPSYHFAPGDTVSAAGKHSQPYPWEQVEFGHKIYRRTKSEMSSNKLPGVEYEDINSGQGTLNKDITKKSIRKRGIFFQPFDVLFGKLRPYLKNWLYPNFKGVAVGDFWVLYSKLLEPSFIYGMIQTQKFQNVANLSSGSKMPRSDWKLVSRTLFRFPMNKNEQRKIGLLLLNLDKTITLHEEQHRQLERLKKALLQKMFADKTGYPALRFKGFTEKWEQSYLKDIASVNSGRDYKHLNKGNIPVYGTGGYMLSVDKALSNTKDGIGIGRKGTINNPYILKAPFWTVDTLFYVIPYNVDLNFLYGIFQKIDWRKKDESTGVPSLSKENINKTKFKIPAISEQREIGTIFQNLDTLITLHQHKIDNLKRLKRALLQKMFV
ncbi:restriction endonuclease subunit S [Limosilactobacillus mucosae]|uniref:restriction endonuclease subunit S n=1 Tax=Limosilactobacillus mucosae TaxID=97478 RepID=UPI0022E44974|nr:restriction endonuclease subunit S [Limosilactobacillus mucosae]